MDLLDLAILALRLALVAVLYGFLLVVLRSAARSLQAARPMPMAAAPRRAELRLLVLAAGASGLKPGQAIDVWDGLTLGRAGAADLALADATVSAEHARVSRSGQAWVVRDLGSTNGTLVNGAPVKGQTALRNGDVLALGGVQFTVVVLSGSIDRAR